MLNNRGLTRKPTAMQSDADYRGSLDYSAMLNKSRINADIIEQCSMNADKCGKVIGVDLRIICVDPRQ